MQHGGTEPAIPADAHGGDRAVLDMRAIRASDLLRTFLRQFLPDDASEVIFSKETQSYSCDEGCGMVMRN
jgi:hypothetical protein